MQKKIVFFSILFLLIVEVIFSQTSCNLIRNGNFEQYSSCPAFAGEMNKATGWNQGTTSPTWPSSDYFNTCGHMNTGGGITPPLPFPSGVGCAGVYTNYGFSPNNYYKEEAAQKLDFCAGQKYRLELYAAKPASGSYINVAGNLSFEIGNAAVLPTNNVNATTFCANGFVSAASIAGNLITPQWQFFSRTFTATQNANAFMITGQCNGPHTVTGYVFFDSLRLLPLDTMIINPTTINTCDTASFTVTIPGGCYGPYSFVITNGSQTNTITNVNSGYVHHIYPAQAGVYTITSMTNKFGCTTALNIPITITGGSAVTLTQNINICLGATYTLPGGTVVNTAGTYVDSINTISGCDSIITTNLALVNALTTSLTSSICAGQTHTLPGGTVVSTAGTYNDTLTAINGGCDSIVTTVLSLLPVSTNTLSPVICPGQTHTLPGGTTVNTAGTYSDTLTAANGCDSIITTNLSVTPIITFSQNITICLGASYTLPGGTSVTSAGVYNDTLTTGSGCDSVITTNLTVSSIITNNQSVVICPGNTHTLPGGAVVGTAGTYYDTLTSQGGCDSLIITSLSLGVLPVGNITGIDTIIVGTSTTLTATGGASYSWSPSSGLNTTSGNAVIASPSSTTTYCVIITDNNGCTSSTCITIVVEEDPCLTIGTLAVPNAFSPNNDGVNDEFCLQGWKPCNELFSIEIYNRWGNLVFKSTDPDFCWEGKQNGQLAEAAVFTYVIRAKFKNVDKPVIKNGNISLIR